MKEIIFYEKNPEIFKELWTKRVEAKAFSPRFLYNFIDYQRHYSNTILRDKSFILIEDQFVMGVFLPIEKNGDFIEVSIKKDYVAAPFFENEKIEKRTMKLIEEILITEKVDSIKFFSDPLQSKISKDSNYNFLRKYGFIDFSADDVIIDLTINNTWAGIRKGHKADIKKILNDSRYKINFSDNFNPNRNFHDLYVALHAKCSGRMTRDPRTFDLQYEMLINSNAFLVSLEFEGKVIGASYFFVLNGGVIYASASDDPEFSDEKRIPIHHVILWSAIDYAKKKGYKQMELCPPSGYSDQLGFLVDVKMNKIAQFKRGFGGNICLFPRGVKYFSKNALFYDINNKTKAMYENFLNSENENPIL